MDQELSNLLRQAVNLLKTGDAKRAQKVLVEILRKDPDVEQAWYMLSFAVPNPERQIYALQQTLKLNPNNEKAKTRLMKLGGTPDPTPLPEKGSIKPPPLPQSSSLLEKKEAIPQPDSEPGADLLSQRLFGSQEEAVEKPSLPIEETTPLDTPEPVFEEEPQEENQKKRKKKRVKKEKKPKKLKKERKGISRRVLVLLILITVFGGLYAMDKMGSIDLSSITGGGASLVGEDTEEVTETPTEGPPTQTPTAVIPTFTPTSALIIPTPTLFSTPDIPEVTLFSVADLPQPDEEIEISLGTLQEEISSIRQLESEIEISSYFVFASTLQRLMSGFSRYPSYFTLINDSSKSYEALGLVDASDDLSSLIPNMWVDPNGVFYIPSSSSVVIVGSSLGGVEKYTYVRGYAQALTSNLVDIEGEGFFPICETTNQQCDAFLALLKGDATLTANLWLEEYATTEENNIVSTMTEKYIFLPVSSPPSFITPQLSFPYEKGLAFVEALYASGGWDKVNSAYINLPTTTEQILHPNKYLSGEGGIEVEARDLGEVLGEGWVQIYGESLGEWKTFQIMAYGISIISTVEIEDAERAAAGWGGDYAQIFITNDRLKSFLSVHWVWDSKAEADEFYRIFGDHLDVLNTSDDVVDFSSGTCWEALLGDTECLFQSGAETYWFKIPSGVPLLSILELYSLDSGG